jgi:hypothetical protein
MDNETAAREKSTLRALLWGALAGALAISLAVKAVDAHGRNAGLHRRLMESEWELQRIQRDEARMRDELKALKEDPLYLQSVLNPPPAGPQEPVVER